MKKLFLLTLFGMIFLMGIVAAEYPAYLQDNIVSCWTLDETSGTSAVDYGLGQQNNGTNNHGVETGATSGTSSLGKAYYFNKTSTSNISMIPSSSLNISNDLSLIVIFNSTASGDQQLAGGAINTAGYQSAFTAGVPATKIVTSGGATFVTGGSAINTGNDVMMITVHSEANSTIYTNGTLATTQASSTGTITNSPTWALGGTGAFDGFSGYISEVALLNVTINSTDAAILWDSGTIKGCRTVVPDVAPTVNLTYPTNNSVLMTNSSNFTINSTAGTYDLVNVTYNVWFSNNTLFNSTVVNITGSGSNVTNLSIANFVNGQSYLFGGTTCQGNGNGTNCTVATVNITFNVSKVYYFWNNFTTTAIEQSSSTFYTNFTVRSGFSVSSVNFTYNQTNYSASFTAINSTSYNASVSVIIPVVSANTNKTFNWTVFLTDGYSLTSANNQQTAVNFALDNCTSNTIQVFNFSLVNEETQVSLVGGTDNTSIKIDLNLFPNATKTVASSTFFSFYNQTLPARVCINSSLAGTTYFADVQVEYSADGYANEFYNIRNYSLNATSNPSENITLYDLNSSDSQVYTITYKDSSFLPVSDALIQIQRKYVDEGVFKTVEIPITDDLGQTVAHLVTNDVIYTFTVVKNGQVLATFTSQNAVCQNPAIDPCEINLNSFLSTIDVTDYENSLDFSYTLTYNASSRTISTTFTIPSGAVSWVTLNVTQEDALGTSVCNNAVTTSAGTLDCVVGSSFGNSTVLAKIYKGGNLVAQGQIKLDQDPSDIYGGIQVVLALFIMLTLIGAAISDSPVYTVIFFMTGVIILFALNLVANNGFIGATATILWLIIAIVIVVIKGANRS